VNQSVKLNNSFIDKEAVSSVDSGRSLFFQIRIGLFARRLQLTTTNYTVVSYLVIIVCRKYVFFFKDVLYKFTKTLQLQKDKYLITFYYLFETLYYFSTNSKAIITIHFVTIFIGDFKIKL
jgi:hypothetical protein